MKVHLDIGNKKAACGIGIPYRFYLDSKGITCKNCIRSKKNIGACLKRIFEELDGFIIESSSEETLLKAWNKVKNTLIVKSVIDE